MASASTTTSTHTTFDPVRTTRKRSRIECAVCCESYVDKKVVECGCGFNACFQCTKRFLLSTSLDAHCMNCNKQWSTDVLVVLLGKTFTYGEWKRWREQVLLDREISMLPETVQHAENEKLRQEMNATVVALKKSKRELMGEINAIDSLIRRTIDNHNMMVFIPEAQQQQDGEGEVGEHVATFVQACASDGCGGFVSTAWKCRKCNGHTCKHCGEFCGDSRQDHICLPANVQALQAIRADATRCPGCGIYIHKIHGCSQMYCTSCHTAFDYRTGKKVIGPIHNPHYQEYRRQQNDQVGGELGDIQCGARDVSSRTLNQFFFELNSIHKFMRSDTTYGKLIEVVNLNRHITRAEMNRYPVDVDRADNRDLRVRLLLGQITRADMKVLLQKREKKRLKSRNIRLIFDMFVATSNDLLRRLVSGGRLTPADLVVRVEQAIKELGALIEYVNDEFGKLGKSCNSSSPFILYRNTTGTYTVTTSGK